MLAPSDIDAKTGKFVSDNLRDKHPDCRTPAPEWEGWVSFEEYLPPREGTPLDCDQETVQEVATKMRGGAGPSSVDGLAMSHWLLRYGKHSQILREELAAWVEWMSNTAPPWAAYRALQTCCLVALDKGTDVRPVGIGEIWKRGISKCALKIVGADAKAACGTH